MMQENGSDKYIKAAYDLSSNVVFFPVRHHSPACAFHLKKAIEAYAPEIILIEGPEGGNAVKAYIDDEETKAPICIYYSYSDSKALIDDSKGKYMCYYPFLDFSPELVALREGRKRKITAEFIDLSYAEMLINSKKAGEAKNNKNTYNDDYMMERSAFIKALCEKESCRSYNELWEKLFEIDGINISTEKFIENMIVSCFLSRVGYDEQLLLEEGCIARETYMAMNIRKAMKEYKRILVVTGGFHSAALMGLIKEEKELKLHKIPEEDEGIYAMAYSFEESDQLNGYASGMPYPNFYQKVWDNLNCKVDKPYEKTVLDFIVRCGGAIRKKEGGLSTADEIEAFSMALGLKNIREKRECGVYELQDGIRSSFVKGELDLASEVTLNQLKKILTGRKIGSLCAGAEVPPIVKDFKKICEYYKLKPSTVKAEVALFIYKNKRQSEESNFFHRMKFLNTNFAILEKGPDFANRKNTNLVRELWNYKWDSRVESSLIELSVYGGTVKEAAASILKKEFEKNKNSAEGASLLLIEAFNMGLEESFKNLSAEIEAIISKDGMFSSVVNCCFNLNFLYNSEELIKDKRDDKAVEFLNQAYNKAVYLMNDTSSVGSEEENKIISNFKDIYNLINKKYLNLDREILQEALEDLIAKKDCNSSVEGAALGILYGINKIDIQKLTSKAEEYLFGTGDKLLKSASFLKGLFSTAKDVLLTKQELLKGLDNVIKNLGEEEFLSIIPDLKLSFTYFNPQEVSLIAASVADFYNYSKEELMTPADITESDIRLAQELDAFAKEYIKSWYF
ncbi:DUF5682 family protein [Clostridium sp. 19966]|uniref:DUF5682 family protein n=1 Tax=Clostridium sp. 19966 TaxID=2768166 RepID=UPI0028E80A2F|nr:DUF5682 family protein [Clostridium sp. 19966]